MKISNYVRVAAAIAVLSFSYSNAEAVQRVRVDITSNAPDGGVALTPVWVGFHDGSFDSYNGGLSSQEGLERLAEDGNTSVISDDFLGGYTYIDNSSGSAVSARVLSSQAGSERVDGTIATSTGAPPLEPGETTSALFDIDTSGINRYFSYASMVLPSNDFYVANGNPTAWDLSSLYDGEGSISFNIGLANTVNDAGTEVESYVTSAANGLFGLAGGQSGPDQGADENGVNMNVLGSDPLSALNFIEGTPAAFDFNNTSLYPNGIATITITAVPEPSSIALGALGLAGIGLISRRRR
ncbi:MAG: spondin domain-containing protein [Planctomycetota bacterium]